MPPFGRLAALIVRRPRPPRGPPPRQRCSRARAPDVAGVRVLGPAPAPLALLRGRYRQRLLVIAAPEIDLPVLLRAWLKGKKLPGNLRLQVHAEPAFLSVIPGPGLHPHPNPPPSRGSGVLFPSSKNAWNQTGARRLSLPPLRGRVGVGGHRSANASLAPRPTKAAANLRRIQVSTRGREMTWSRIAAANTP